MANKYYKSFRKAVDKSITSSEKAVLTAIGEFVEGDAKVRAPYDTNNLRDSIGYIVNDSAKSVVIGTNVEYAIYQEKGWSRGKAQPFLLPSVESNVQTINKLAQGAWKM